LKFQIRHRVRQRRLLLTEDEREKLSRRLIERLSNLLSLIPHAESSLFFYPIKGEPNLLPLAEKLLRLGKTVSFPKVEGKELIPISISSLRELTPGKFNIPEPPMDVKRVVKSIDVVFVPGLAFDLFGYRIGYGGGFYDRFLSKNPSSKKIGICFSFQLFSELPHDPFDVPVDYIVTDKNWTRRKEWRQS
jgi:5-formyltetrahydrofolate cyclo-ligase